ncbi:MucR family transcriptional regulator [Bosea sp. AS-1]|uniref:MucR family transcriptional regulator n=2 Tax=Bosea TaxID=85413 RepID=A0A927HZA3_9HYPH|nr:MucR family transcriptional regulator [Bosea spartocytisi]MCP4549361.1 hypothetical protein [bacterium]
MKRYLSTRYGLTSAQYRYKWNLPAHYPMVAPSYAKARSQLARSQGPAAAKSPAQAHG